MNNEIKNYLGILGIILLGTFLIFIGVLSNFQNQILIEFGKSINSFFNKTQGFWSFLQGMGTVVALIVFIYELKKWKKSNQEDIEKDKEDKAMFHNTIEPNLILTSIDLKSEENTKLRMNLDIVKFEDGIEKLTIDYAKYKENDMAPIAYLYNSGESAAYDISICSAKVKPIPNTKFHGTLDFTKKYERHEEDLIPSMYPNHGMIWGIEFKNNSIFEANFNCKIGFLVLYRDRFSYKIFKKLFLIQFVEVCQKSTTQKEKPKIISLVNEIVLRERDKVNEITYSNDSFDEIIIPTKLGLHRNY